MSPALRLLRLFLYNVIKEIFLKIRYSTFYFNLIGTKKPTLNDYHYSTKLRIKSPILLQTPDMMSEAEIDLEIDILISELNKIRNKAKKIIIQERKQKKIFMANKNDNH